MYLIQSTHIFIFISAFPLHYDNTTLHCISIVHLWVFEYSHQVDGSTFVRIHIRTRMYIFICGRKPTRGSVIWRRIKGNANKIEYMQSAHRRNCRLFALHAFLFIFIYVLIAKQRMQTQTASCEWLGVYGHIRFAIRRVINYTSLCSLFHFHFAFLLLRFFFYHSFTIRFLVYALPKNWKKNYGSVLCIRGPVQAKTLYS